ncbi:MAG: DUF4230 domain-containing protein [Lachnospiraceae bacterium]|nr:DUF4230 domain-containing protein [Lachnospiraceae bacterium]
MQKITTLRILCVILFLAICATLIWGRIHEKNSAKEASNDGIEQIDLDTIYLVDSKVQVDFSEVIIGTHDETRKLIVSTQEATVSTELTDQLIRKIDFDFLKKTQKVSYTGTGYFVVDLDNLTKDNIKQDKKNKTITIQIDHAYLQAIEIDPNKIIIDEVKEGLLAKGDIELTVKDYNTIEKQLRNRLEEKFNTALNGQNADAVALRMVKEVYEPIIKAIDSSYTLYVEFK